MQISSAFFRIFSIFSVITLAACSSGGSDGSSGGTVTTDGGSEGVVVIAAPVVTSVVSGDGEVRLSWSHVNESDASDDQGGAIVEYNLHYANATTEGISIADLLNTTTTVTDIEALGSYQLIEDINATTYTVDGLDNLSLYYFILTAIFPEDAGDDDELEILILPSFEAYAMPRADVAPAFQALNDTGVTLCADYTYGLPSQDTIVVDGLISFEEIDVDGDESYFEHDNRIDCFVGDVDDDMDPIPTPEQQDYAQGLDSLATTEADDLDGVAGFSFTKLDANGNELDSDAEEPEVVCIRDNITQLIWEAKSSDQDSVHYSKDRFSWYDDDSQVNGETAGFSIPSTAAANGDQGNSICEGYDAADEATFCNTQAFVARVNADGLCGSTAGSNEWRLPTLAELRSIVNYGAENEDEDAIVPSVDTNFFPNTEVDGGLPDTTFDGGIRYWSSQTSAGGASLAWAIYYGYGGTIALNKGTPNAVRLVRSAQ